MLPAERRSIAQRVAAKLSQTSTSFLPFEGVIESRVVTALTAIDSTAAAADSPLLVAELLPSVDLLVARDFSRSAPTAAVDAPSLDSIWEADSVNNDWIEVLTELVTGAISHAGGENKDAGAYHHQGGDGMHYFVFDMNNRSEALRQLGIEDADVITISPLAVEA